MSLKHFLAFILVWGLAYNASFGQIIADFNFRDNGSLTTNDAGEDAFYVNPRALSKEGGIYLPDGSSEPNENQFIDLRIDESLLSSTESIFLEFHYQSNESFGWLIFSGYDSHFGIAHLESQGFRIRYYTNKNPDQVIQTSFIPHPLARGEKAVITFIYSKEEGTAYLLKDGTEIWQTPEEKRTPGYALHWFTENGYFSVGAHMGEEPGDDPHLYYFRAYEEPCLELSVPSVKNDTICGPATAVLSASGGANGNYRWYESDSETAEPLNHYDSTFITPVLSQNTSYYVALKKGPCEGERVKVTAFVNLPPTPPGAEKDVVSRCGPGKLPLSATGGSEGAYRWYKGSTGTNPIPGAVNSTYETDFLDKNETYFVTIAGENCESEPIEIHATILQAPEPPQIEETLSRCGPGEVEVEVFNSEELHSSGLRLYGQQDDLNPVYEQSGGTLLVKAQKDTLLYVSATNEYCESEKVPLKIRVLPLPTLNAGEDLTILKGESVKLKAEGNFSSVQWEPFRSMDISTIETPTVKPEHSTSYIVRALNENGCQKSDTVKVFVVDKYPVPNAFSPNNDGINDLWEIPGIDQYPNCRIFIFNRWGNQVFYSKGYQKPWNGTFKGKGLPAATYYYTLQLSPEHELVKGSVFLIK